MIMICLIHTLQYAKIITTEKISRYENYDNNYGTDTFFNNFLCFCCTPLIF